MLTFKPFPFNGALSTSENSVLTSLNTHRYVRVLFSYKKTKTKHAHICVYSVLTSLNTHRYVRVLFSFFCKCISIFATTLRKNRVPIIRAKNTM